MLNFDKIVCVCVAIRLESYNVAVAVLSRHVCHVDASGDNVRIFCQPQQQQQQ